MAHQHPRDEHLDDHGFVEQSDVDERTIYFTGDVDSDNITQAISYLARCCSKDIKQPITMVLNTYGGSAHDMFALYDFMQHIRAPIHTIGLGKIMSAGVLLLAAGKKGQRRIGQHTSLMMHSISSAFYGSIFDQHAALGEVDRLQKQLNDCLCRHTSMTQAQLEAFMSQNTDVYMSPTDALTHGIIDSIL